MKYTKDQLINAQGTGFKYMQRAGIFKGNNGNCTFNPETGVANSYGWYTLAERIKGIQILNVYSYSNQTAKHRGKVASVMRNLGITYACLEAPSGLQDLNASRDYHVRELGIELVKEKYARIKSSSQIKRHLKALALLTRLSVKHTKKSIVEATNKAEISRALKLQRERDVRLFKRIERTKLHTLVNNVNVEMPF